MSISDFEPDPDYSSLGSVLLSTDAETGRLVANAAEVEEFDPRIENDLEGLLYLGYLTKNCSIFTHQFVLKTLTRGEKLAILRYCADYDDTMGIGDALETATLALAVVTANGRPLSVALTKEETAEDRLQRNFPIVAKWYDPVLEELYLEYQELVQRMNAAFAALQSKSQASRRTR